MSSNQYFCVTVVVRHNIFLYYYCTINHNHFYSLMYNTFHFTFTFISFH